MLMPGWNQKETIACELWYNPRIKKKTTLFLLMPGISNKLQKKKHMHEI